MGQAQAQRPTALAQEKELAGFRSGLRKEEALYGAGLQAQQQLLGAGAALPGQIAGGIGKGLGALGQIFGRRGKPPSETALQKVEAKRTDAVVRDEALDILEGTMNDILFDTITPQEGQPYRTLKTTFTEHEVMTIVDRGLRLVETEDDPRLVAAIATMLKRIILRAPQSDTKAWALKVLEKARTRAVKKPQGSSGLESVRKLWQGSK